MSNLNASSAKKEIDRTLAKAKSWTGFTLANPVIGFREIVDLKVIYRSSEWSLWSDQ